MKNHLSEFSQTTSFKLGEYNLQPSILTLIAIQKFCEIHFMENVICHRIPIQTL